MSVKLLLKNVMTKNNTCVLLLVNLFETGHTKANKGFGVLRYVIYNIIDNFLCIDYLACK